MKLLDEALTEAIGINKLAGPDGQSVHIDMEDLYLKDPDTARQLIESATSFNNNDEIVRKLVVKYTGVQLNYHIRPYGLPTTEPISNLARQAFEGKVVQFKGIVTQVTPVRKLMSKKVFICKLCGVKKTYEGDTVQKMLDMPKRKFQMFWCPSHSRRSPYVLSIEDCVLVPVQKIVIQETLEEMMRGKPPSKIMAWATDDLAADKVTVGEQIICVGIIRPEIKETNITYAVMAELLSIKKVRASYEEVKISADDYDKILNIAKKPDVYNVLVRSFAPTIYGYEDEKMALLCALFGSPRLKRDSTDIRGDIHVLLAGDPGLAKSQLVSYAAKVSPRGVAAMGTRATGAGLTASWTKGSDGVSEMMPGAMVIADGGGMVCIDEIDKVDKTQLLSIHGPMEQQVLEVAMAGNIQKFNTRCSVVAAANPKSGRYNPEKTIVENINLDPALLSRFDLIFTMRDQPKRETEEKLADHILRTHAGHSRHGPVDMELLRKYIAVARRIEPGFEQDGPEFKTLKEGYLNIRLSSKDGRIPATPRQLEALIRVAKALARMKLSKEVKSEHVKMSLELYDKASKYTTLDPETGIRDVYIIETGKSTTQVNKEERIWSWIIEEAKLNKGRVYKRKIRNRAFQLEEMLNTVVEQKKVEGVLEDLDKDWWTVNL